RRAEASGAAEFYGQICRVSWVSWVWLSTGAEKLMSGVVCDLALIWCSQSGLRCRSLGLMHRGCQRLPGGCISSCKEFNDSLHEIQLPRTVQSLRGSGQRSA